ncbi:hypothetical protein ACA910_010252 [Epithemia clementina (nom. ined.)]
MMIYRWGTGRYSGNGMPEEVDIHFRPELETHYRSLWRARFQYGMKFDNKVISNTILSTENLYRINEEGNIIGKIPCNAPHNVGPLPLVLDNAKLTTFVYGEKPKWEYEGAEVITMEGTEDI